MATTTAADLLAGAIAMVGEARFTIEHQAVFTQTVMKDRLEQGEKSKYIPKFGTVSCEDLTDGVDISNAQTLTITGTTHTTDEAGCKVIVTKKLRNQLKANAFQAAGVVIGNSMQKSIDLAGLALYSGLDSGLSHANTSFTLGYFAAAVTQCMGQSEPCPMPLALVSHPYLLHPIIDLLATPANTAPVADSYQEAVLGGHFMGINKLYGTPVFRDANASIDSNADTYGAIYSKQAFIYLVGYEIENWVVYDDSLRGWEIGIVHDYKMVEEDGTYGRYLLFDATAPTS